MLPMSLPRAVQTLRNARNRAAERRRRPFYQALEALEPRQLMTVFTSSLVVAPGGASATFTDADGDLATVAVSKGALQGSDFVMFLPSNLHDQIQTLTLTDPSFAGANVTISVKKVAGGDGVTNVGMIDATGVDLGAVKITGDLGRIDAGDSHTTTSALTSLSVTTMGRNWTTDQGPAAPIESDIVGNLGSLTVAHDFSNAFINVVSGTDSLNANIGAITIGGSLIGGAADSSARIAATGNIGMTKITGDVLGGAGSDTANISAQGAFAGVTVGGSVIGNGFLSATLLSNHGAMGNIAIGGSLLGGPSAYSGYLAAYNAGMGNVTIGGSFVAGSGGGKINARLGNMGALTVAGDIIGNVSVFANGAIKSISVGGSAAGQITANGALGTIKVGGNFSGTLASFGQTIGNVTIGGAVNATISAGGSVGTIKVGGDVSGFFNSDDSSISSITIGGSILSGTVHADTGIGAISIARDFVSGTINADSSAIKSLTVGGSIGIDANLTARALGTTRITGDCDINSLRVTGALAGLTVGGSFNGYLHVGSSPGTIAIGRDDAGSINFDDSGHTVTVGGTMAGILDSTHNIATIKVGNDLTGIVQLTNGAIGSIAIGGSVIGSVSNYTGFIDATTIGKLTVSHSIVGGAGYLTGAVRSHSTIGSVTVGGSIIGGTFSDSGMILSPAIGTVKIAHNITAGSTADAGEILANGAGIGATTIGGDMSGTISAFANIASVSAGSMSAGFLHAAGTLGTTRITGDFNAMLVASNFTTITVGGSFGSSQGLIGPGTSLSVAGNLTGVFEPLSAIGSLTIGGSLLGSVGLNGTKVVKVGGDLSGHLSANGSNGTMTIGGSIIGGAISSSGFLSINRVGVLKIGGSIVGGSGTDSGDIYAGSVGTATVGGSIVGGSGGGAGAVAILGSTGTFTVVGNIRGGTAQSTGVLSTGTTTAIVVNGSVLGGNASFTGQIIVDSAGSVTVKQNVFGGTNNGTASMTQAGVIFATHNIGSVTLGGSIFAGKTPGGGTITQSGAILAGDNVTSITVKGSLVGNTDGASHINTVVISARGQAVQGASTDIALGTVTIGGRMEFADILAGYDLSGNPVNGDAQITSVKIGGDFTASNIIAGIQNTASNNINFGNGGDTSIGAGTPGISATIGSISIGGIAQGTPFNTSSSDHFGIVSQIIGPVSINGTLVTLAPDIALGTTGDVDLAQI